MRKILLVEKDGEKFYAITSGIGFGDEVIGFEVKSTCISIPTYKLCNKLTRIEKGREKETIGFLTVVKEGEVDLYNLLNHKSGKHVYGKGWMDEIYYLKQEKINILEEIWDINNS